MCGIVGVYNFTGGPVSSKLVEKMGQTIRHRGPDGEGVWCDGPIGLGHQRLAIIDISSAGHQPMQTPDSRFVITYNGEVYNFRELRVELESLGHQFHSATDTEVVLHSFAEWGLDSLTRFNGMFAFAVWDKQLKQLHLARDRYGIKPVYYAHLNNSLVFGSEIKAILQHPEVSANLDESGLFEYFSFQNILTNRTLLKNISILEPGTVITFSNNGTAISHQYWDFQFESDSGALSEQDCIDGLDFYFSQAVNRQLVSDVEIGSYLSGGMDSASIVALAAKQLPYIKTFTCGFDLSSASGMELSYDERKDAEYLSYMFKTEHYEMVLKAGDMERCMPRLAYHIEEPRVGQSYPNYHISKLVSRFTKVTLAGTGGDEIFAGYPWRYYLSAKEASVNGLYSEEYYRYWARILSEEEIHQAFSPIKTQVQQLSQRDIFESVYCSKMHSNSGSDIEKRINNALYFEAKTFLHGLLVVEDKLSMSHGLECRVPFLDNDLVDFAMKIPLQYKLARLQKGYSPEHNTNDGKLVLRKMLSRYVPAKITDKVKQGFSAPDSSWFKGESIEYVRKLLLNENAMIYRYLDRKIIEKKINSHLDGKENLRLQIWSLLSFEHWCQQYF